MAVVKYRKNPDIILESMSPLIFLGMCAAKLITCLFKSNKVSVVFDAMEK